LDVLFNLDLLVYCNYKVLDGLDYQIDGTILSFETPERQPGEVDLEVTIIDVQNINSWVELYHFKKQYLPHGILFFLFEYVKQIIFIFRQSS
jgi:hypothetical protein